jgi:hypothetical protein
MGSSASARPRYGLILAIAAAFSLGVGCSADEERPTAPASKPPPPPVAAGPSGRIELGEGGSVRWLDEDRILHYGLDGLAAIDVETKEREIVLPSSDGTRLASMAVVSPDGTRLAFARHLAWDRPPVLQVLPLGEKEPVSVAPTPEGPYGHDLPVWSPDGRQLAYLDRNRGMAYIVAADGRSEPQVLPPDFVGFEVAAVVDWWGDRMLVSAGTGSASGLYVVPVGGGPRLRIDGEGEPKPGGGPVAVGFSPDGRKVAYVRPDGGLWLAASDGSWRRHVNEDVGPSNRGWLGASFAPDGRVAFAVDEGLWLADADGRSPTQLTDSGCHAPLVSPDGSKVSCYYSEEDAGGGGNKVWVTIVELESPE